MWRIFTPEADRVTVSYGKKSSAKPGPIIEKESKFQACKNDLAYKSASEDMKAYLRNRNTSQAIKAYRMNRILRVLRASLQPIPKFRDPRPWKFLNKTLYPNILVVNKKPERDINEFSSLEFIDLESALSATTSTEGELRNNLANARAKTEQYVRLTYAYAQASIPDLVVKNQNRRLLSQSSNLSPLKFHLGGI